MQLKDKIKVASDKLVIYRKYPDGRLEAVNPEDQLEDDFKSWRDKIKSKTNYKWDMN
jgi:hypothetical protein